ncbi:MAG: metal-sensitive transcriptional regulator [Bacteroidetes bacterium]|nr:metal-sensitive transcriptional regulator [Bacteroidota bacterium]
MRHKLKKEDINKRLNKAVGQINGIKKMIEDERDCPDILIQIAAVRSALATLGLMITEDHIEHCVTESFQTGKGEESIAELSKALKQMLK